MLIVAGAETKCKNKKKESAMDLAQSSLLRCRSFTKTDGRAECVFPVDSVSRHVCTIMAEVSRLCKLQYTCVYTRMDTFACVRMFTRTHMDCQPCAEAYGLEWRVFKTSQHVCFVRVVLKV